MHHQDSHFTFVYSALPMWLHLASQYALLWFVFFLQIDYAEVDDPEFTIVVPPELVVLLDFLAGSFVRVCATVCSQ